MRDVISLLWMMDVVENVFAIEMREGCCEGACIHVWGSDFTSIQSGGLAHPQHMLVIHPLHSKRWALALQSRSCGDAKDARNGHQPRRKRV